MVATELPVGGPSEISSSDLSNPWQDLPEPSVISGNKEAEEVKGTTSQRICLKCGDPIVREPGTRGRLPRYHPECKPAPTSERASSARRTKIEAEAEAIANRFREAMNKTAIVVGMVDPFDGFAVVVESKPASEALEQIMISYPLARKYLSNVEGTGGIFAFVMSMLFIALPILAHHKILPPSLKINDMLEKIPAFVQKMNQQLTEAESDIAQKLSDDAEEAKEKKEV